MEPPPKWLYMNPPAPKVRDLTSSPLGGGRSFLRVERGGGAGLVFAALASDPKAYANQRICCGTKSVRTTLRP